jgi:hypothetical protein
VAGADGIIRVHVPFSMTDLSQTEKRLGSFSNDSASYIKFSNPSLIFKENLNRQRMALKSPREIL